jgi:hypothetical protein
VEGIVRSAARRQLAILVIEQIAFALAPVLGGTILLLLLGTQILHWYWIAFLGLGGVALATIRIRDRKTSPYRTAQILDRRFHLEDSLSTAWFLLDGDRTGPHTASAEFQLQQAEEIAGNVQPSAAFPVSFGRAWVLSGALAMVAFGLFTARYLVTRSLTFEQSLIPIQITLVFERLEAKLFAPKKTPGDTSGNDPIQADADRSNSQSTSPEPAETPQLRGEQPSTTPDPNGNARSTTQANAGKPGDPQSKDGQTREAQSGNAQSDGKQSDQPSATEKTVQSGDPQQQPNGGQQGSQGLMEKMRDALSSLMSKLHQDSAHQGQQSSRPSDQDSGSRQSSGQAQQGQQQDARNQQSAQDQASDAQAQAQATERTDASQGRSSDSSPQKGSDARSGIGRQDGDKALKEAEQLQAMGKLAEIIGKRSASLTGEMTVETGSGKQQLKTAYTQKLGRHSDSGGEINRDEVPLEDQQYVRTYMEMVRNQGKTGK